MSVLLQIKKRQVFYSFHYDNDCWRANIVRNIGVVEGNNPVSPNKWEEIKKKGNAAVYRWIDENLKYRSCTIVLIGEETYKRPFVLYEIRKSWELKKGVFGIYIHGLEDDKENTANKGENPFLHAKIPGMMYPSTEVDVYDVGYKFSSYRPCDNIKSNLSSWIEKAIKKRDTWVPVIKS